MTATTSAVLFRSESKGRGFHANEALKADFVFVYIHFNIHPYQTKATITRCDLSPRFFCTDATLLCEFERDKI